MNTAFSEALAPLSRRLPRAVNDIEILRVSAQLSGDDFASSLEAARTAALVWTKKRVGRTLPRDAWDLRDFELLAGGRNSAAVCIKDDQVDL
jgi:hypothetical protein